MLKNLLRVGSGISDLEGRESSHIWIHPDGKLYVRYSFKNAIPGWKLSGERIIDYWGLTWLEMIPASQICIENLTLINRRKKLC